MSSDSILVADTNSSVPSIGKPWNFHGILEAYLIPRVIAADSKLSPGARLLWGVIRQYSWRNGRCTLSDEALARAVAVTDRQCRRYFQQLTRAGLLGTTPRAGKTPLRELLWDARFAGKIRPTPDIQVRGGGHISPGGRTYSATPYKEAGSSQVGSRLKNAGDVQKSSTKTPELRANKPPAEWTEEDYRARGRACGFPDYVIERDIERLRAANGKGSKERMRKAVEFKPALEEATRR